MTSPDPHAGHDTYRIAGKSSADPRRRCHDCGYVYNPVLRAQWLKEKAKGKR